MAGTDRRMFLRAAGQLAAGIAAADAGGAFADPALRPTDPRAPLKSLDGNGLMPAPSGAIRRLGDQKMRIMGTVRALQFSPNGNTLVSATSGELRGWDPRTGRVLFRLGFPAEASVDSGRLTSRDTFILLVRPESGGTQELRQYAFGTGKLISRSPGLKFQNTERTAFSPDGSQMAAVYNEALAAHDTATGAEKWRESLSEQVTDAYFFPDGSTLALAVKGDKGGVKLFAAATGKLAGTLQAFPRTIDPRLADPVGVRNGDHVSNLAASRDGRWLAASVGEDEDTVLCWDVKSAQVKHRLEPAGKPLGFKPDGSELATVYHGRVTFWSTASGKAIRHFSVPTGDLHLSPDGKILAAECDDAAVLVDAATGNRRSHSADPPGNPSDLQFVGRHRLRGRLNPWGGWVEWDLRTGTRTLLRPAGGGQTPVTLTADGRTALYRHEGVYTAFAMATGHPIRSVKLGDDDNDRFELIALTPDGKAFVRAIGDGLAVIADEGRRVIRRRGEATGQAAVVATDARSAAVGYRGGDGNSQVDLYDLPGGRHLHAIRLDGEVGRVALSSDGRHMIVSHDLGRDFRRGRKSVTAMFNVGTGKAVFRTEPTEDDVELSVVLSTDGRMLARVGTGGLCRIWDVAAGQVRHIIEVGKDAELNAVAFSPDARTLAVSANGGPVFLWDLYPGTPLRLAAEDLECGWRQLRDGDAAAAFKAVRLLVRASAQAVAFLAGRVTPLARPDPQAVARHIADLDHKEFRKRESAARSLAELGERAREPMNAALAAGPSPETRDRLERLLAADEKPTTDQLRRLRAIEVVEVIGTGDAAELLRTWAGGAPGARFTTESADAVRRLAGRAR